MSRKFAACLLIVLAIALVSCTPDRAPSRQQDVAAEAIATPSQPLDEFLNEASLAVVLRFPETITHLGIGEWIGVRNDQLMPLTHDYERETISLLEDLIEQLAQYDLSAVDERSALSARVYGWYLQDLLQAHRYSDHAYSVSTHLSSYPDTLERLLTRTQPLRSSVDVQDYMSRLGQIGERFDELIVRLADSEAIGATPPSFILTAAAAALRQTADQPPEQSDYYLRLGNGLLGISSLSQSVRDATLREAAEIIEKSVFPAYLRLSQAVSSQAVRAGDAIGVWRHEGGSEYYAYVLRKHTTTDLSADDIHALGVQEVSRIQGEIRDVAAALGFDPELDIRTLYAQLTEITGVATGQQTVAFCRATIDDIASIIRPAFSTWPNANIEVIEGQTSAYFSPGSLDGARPGQFIAPAARQQPLFALPTLVYHEAIPGHGLQTAFAYAADLPAYRAGMGFTAYAEGWALYAERLAWEMGAYQGDAYGNLGRLQAELFRAVRLVVDTGIHAKQWTYRMAVDYFQQNTGLDEAYARQEIERYAVNPGQATAYKIGMLKILELRDQAERELGEAFDLPAFHQAILEESDVPLVLLEELVSAYIERSQ
ncbi:DUF885 domain-containing protein [Candidatus Bipolaricaulota bacterium]|nr:DUF885 domain-containing protein [Candidatus Bipolaricaulota bacterium]